MACTTPAECESERTVIISELQGGENDPDQLLDTEVTATAFRAHPYGHPTIGWLGDLRSMTRDDLYGHYRRFYIPNNATLVVVGDVDADDVLRRAAHHFSGIAPGAEPERIRIEEPPQLGERRVLLEREGTTGYVKMVFHAPAARDAGLLPDARPRCGADRRQRRQSVVELPWIAAAAEGAAVHGARRVRARLGRLRRAPARPSSRFSTRCRSRRWKGRRSPPSRPRCRPKSSACAAAGVDAAEIARAKRQLRARLVFENDSVTNVAHQLGYFETVTGPDYFGSLQRRIDAVTAEQVWDVARRRLAPACRTVGWFRPLESH